MPKYIPLSKSQHQNAGLLPTDYRYALEQAVVPLVMEELPHVLPTMAIGFVPSAKEKEFNLVALQSLQANVNVYVHTNGRWIGGYRPAWYRAYPFKLIKDSQNARQVVCVDESASAFEQQASEQAIKLFDAQGELTARMRDTITFLEKLQQGTLLTQTLVNQLSNTGVIVPWSLNTKTAENDETRAVTGLYHIDEAALKTLSATTLAELATSGALSLAYTQLLSEHRLQGLSRLYELRNLANEQAKQADEINLDKVFGEEDDDLFKF